MEEKYFVKLFEPEALLTLTKKRKTAIGKLSKEIDYVCFI